MKKIRYGVIGIKGTGSLHIRFAKESEEVELTALVDVDEALVKEKSAELGIRGFTDYREMLDAGIVDAVSIATPHYLHAPMSLGCLNAGVHIFVEKPIATRISEADKIIEIAKSKNLKICVGHQYRTFRTSRTMKHLIDSGAIGKVMRALWTWIEFRPEGYYARDVWRKTWGYSGGGIIMHNLSHDLDLICWMIGKPVHVTALVGNQLHKTEVEDICCANILFENGAFATVQATINQPRGCSIRQVAGSNGTIVIQDVNSLTFDRKDRILLGKYEDSLSTRVSEINGFEDQPGTVWQCITPLGDPPKWKKLMERMGLLKIRRTHGLSLLMSSFVDAILNNREPVVSGANTLQTLELLSAIVLSGVRKKAVDLPIEREEYDELYEELSSGKAQVPRFYFSN